MQFFSGDLTSHRGILTSKWRVSSTSQRFVKWYRLAQDVLGSGLISKLSDQNIEERVSRNEILVFPIPGEESVKETSSRPDPVIYIIDREGENRIQLGLECNTLKSVSKLRNILDSYHSKDKSEFLTHLSRVDDSFETLLYVKLKPWNFGQSPKYDPDLKFVSNQITENKIDQLFSAGDAIRRKGTERRLKEGLSHPPEAQP